MLTAFKLNKRLYYNPDTGNFRWLNTGLIAGWSDKNGYRRIQISGKRYAAHRLAFLYVTGKFPNGQIDHINHDRSDNRFKNLRDVTPSENQRNRTLSKNNTSGYSGIYWHERDNAWRVVLYINNKNTYIGQRKLLHDAVKVLEKALIKHNFHPNHGKKI